MSWRVPANYLLLDWGEEEAFMGIPVLLDRISILPKFFKPKFFFYETLRYEEPYTLTLRGSTGLKRNYHHGDCQADEYDYLTVAEYATEALPRISDDIAGIITLSGGPFSELINFSSDVRASLDNFQWDISNGFYTALQRAVELQKDRSILPEDAREIVLDTISPLKDAITA
jgi:hypothetical protein